MAALTHGQELGRYVVKNLIKQNRYTETYRVEDEDHHPFFLKLFILKDMPAKLVNPETGIVFEIEYSKQLTHKNLVSYVDSGTVNLERGECSCYLTNYFTGELLAEKLYREGKSGKRRHWLFSVGFPKSSTWDMPRNRVRERCISI